MFESTASDFDRRNNGFDIPRLDMATQTTTLFGYFSFPEHYDLYYKFGQFLLSLPVSLCILTFFYFQEIFIFESCLHNVILGNTDQEKNPLRLLVNLFD